MSDEIMPAAEAAAVDTDERNHYELAFHVLPTVAEGEVTGVFDAVKALITKAGGEITTEEAPAHFELAYDIIKHIEGKNRRFGSAYFGWVRFKSTGDSIEELSEELEHHKDLLRHLLIKLSKAEEAHPFMFHEALVSQKMVTTVEESSVVPDTTTVVHEDGEDDSEIEVETPAEVDETELDAALKKEETE